MEILGKIQSNLHLFSNKTKQSAKTQKEEKLKMALSRMNLMEVFFLPGDQR